MLAQLLCGALLFMLTFSGILAVWPMFTVLVRYGSARAFMLPATQAILINLVPQASVGRAVALSSSTFQVAVIAGPVPGGLLSLAGAKVGYAIVAGLLLLAVIVIDMTCMLAPQSGPREPVSWHSLLQGLRSVRSPPVVLEAISLHLFAVLFGGATALLPALARHVMHAAPTTGLPRMTPGVDAGDMVVCAASAGAAGDTGEHSRPGQRGQFGPHRHRQ